MGSANTSSTPSTITRRETLDSIEYLQVSDGLEILVSLESRLTFNIRCESADEFGEVHQDFTEAADWPRIPFLLTRRLSGTAENLYGESSSDAKLRLIRTCFRRVPSFFHTSR